MKKQDVFSHFRLEFTMSKIGSAVRVFRNRCNIGLVARRFRVVRAFFDMFCRPNGLQFSVTRREKTATFKPFCV